MENMFEISDLGIMKYFLGMKIVQNNSGDFISQKKYVAYLLKKFKIDTCKEVATPRVK